MTVEIEHGRYCDEEMKKQMGRKVWKPDYDKLAGYLYEDMPPEIKIKFIQSFLHADSPEMSVQRILGVDSLDEAVLKLVKTKEQQKRLLEFLQRNLDDGGN